MESRDETQKKLQNQVFHSGKMFIRFRKNKFAMFGVVILILLVFMAIFGPYMTDYDYATNDLTNTNQPPSSEHWFGTDDFGRDVFTVHGKVREFHYLLGLQQH